MPSGEGVEPIESALSVRLASADCLGRALAGETGQRTPRSMLFGLHRGRLAESSHRWSSGCRGNSIPNHRFAYWLGTVRAPRGVPVRSQSSFSSPLTGPYRDVTIIRGCGSCSRVLNNDVSKTSPRVAGHAVNSRAQDSGRRGLGS